MVESSSHPLASSLSPRLVLGASAWLLVSWALNLAIDGPIRMSAETMLPAVRWLLLAAILGVHLIWPAWRLAQARPVRPLAQTWLDMLCLALVFQITIWPLRLLVEWTFWQATLINLATCLWLLPVGLCIYLGIRTTSSLTRVAVQLIALALLLAGPIYAILADDPASYARNPLALIWQLASETRSDILTGHVGFMVTIAITAMIGWLLAICLPFRSGMDERDDLRNNK